MRSRERVEAALAHQRADRPPIGAWGHSYSDEWEPERLAATTAERAARLGWDFVKFQPRATCFAEAFGAEYRPSGTASEGPVLVRPAVTSPAGWDSIDVADPGVAPLADQFDALAAVVAELGPAVPVLQTVFSPLTVAGYLVGKDPARAVRELTADPESVGGALERIAHTLGAFAELSVEAGAAGVFYAISGYASPQLMSPAAYRELALPHDMTVLAGLPPPAWFNVLHLCGAGIDPALARELPVGAVSWSIHEDGNPSLSRGRDEAQMAVMGGVAHRTTLVTGSPSDVAAEVRSAVAGTGGRGLLIAPGCSVPPEAPEANLAAMAQAAGG